MNPGMATCCCLVAHTSWKRNSRWMNSMLILLLDSKIWGCEARMSSIHFCQLGPSWDENPDPRDRMYIDTKEEAPAETPMSCALSSIPTLYTGTYLFRTDRETYKCTPKQVMKHDISKMTSVFCPTSDHCRSSQTIHGSARLPQSRSRPQSCEGSPPSSWIACNWDLRDHHFSRRVSCSILDLVGTHGIFFETPRNWFKDRCQMSKLCRGKQITVCSHFRLAFVENIASSWCDAHDLAFGEPLSYEDGPSPSVKNHVLDKPWSVTCGTCIDVWRTLISTMQISGSLALRRRVIMEEKVAATWNLLQHQHKLSIHVGCLALAFRRFLTLTSWGFIGHTQVENLSFGYSHNRYISMMLVPKVKQAYLWRIRLICLFTAAGLYPMLGWSQSANLSPVWRSMLLCDGYLPIALTGSALMPTTSTSWLKRFATLTQNCKVYLRLVRLLLTSCLWFYFNHFHWRASSCHCCNTQVKTLGNRLSIVLSSSQLACCWFWTMMLLPLPGHLKFRWSVSDFVAHTHTHTFWFLDVKDLVLLWAVHCHRRAPDGDSQLSRVWHF